MESAVAVAFQVFLSHNSRDKSVVARLAVKLKREGVEPWLDSWNLTPGGRWQEELAAGLRNASACAVFIGPDDIGDWEREELAVASNRAATDRDFRLFLVLLPGVPDRFDADALSPFLSMRTWVDLRAGVDDPRGFQALVNAVHGIPLGPDIAIEPRPGICPYRGLRPFEEDDAEFFFGRDADIQRLLEKLKSTSVLAVVGSSGSGKSSLARAGLVPALRRGALAGSEEWEIVTLKPGAHPLDTLAGHVAALGLRSRAADASDELAGDPRTLRLLCAARERPILWFIDQFEEVFTLCRDEGERAQLIANLLHASTGGGPSIVIATMRADFYPRCAAYPELAQTVSAHQALVGPMDVDGLRQAIEEPALRVGLELEPGLVDTILADVSAQPGALPLLEHALLELWERRRGNVMTLQGYRESGGVEGAVSKRAEAVFDGFSPEQQLIARRAFLRLTQPGEGTEDTRRRAEVAELVTSGRERGALEEVIRALVAGRMLTTGGEGGGEGWVDVSHEALIRGWPRLRGWIDEDRAGLRIHGRVTEATREWIGAGRDDGLLHRGARLVEATEWSSRHAGALNDHEREFLAASTQLAERERQAEEEQRARQRELVDAKRRARRLRAGLVLGICVAMTLPVLAQQRPDRRLEDKLGDVRRAIRGGGAPSDRVVIVAIDDASLRRLGLWPFSRKLHARVIDRLRRAGARVTAYDIQFTSESDDIDADNALIEAVRRSRNVVLATTGDPPAGVFGGGEALTYSRALPADSELPADPDGLTRHVAAGSGLPGFALRTAERALGHSVRLSDHAGAWIDFPSSPVKTVSFADLLDGRVSASVVRDKVVMVGATAPALQDLHETPEGTIPGIELQADSVDTILRGFPLRDPPRWLDLLVVGLVGVVVPLLLLRLSPKRAFIPALGVALVFAVGAQVAFSHGLVFTMLHPIVALIVSALVALVLELRAPRAMRR
jgi:CHASE2 domain-containing sensor protein